MKFDMKSIWKCCYVCVFCRDRPILNERQPRNCARYSRNMRPNRKMVNILWPARISYAATWDYIRNQRITKWVVRIYIQFQLDRLTLIQIGFVLCWIAGVCETASGHRWHQQRWPHFICRISSVRRPALHTRRPLQNSIPAVRHKWKWLNHIQYVYTHSKCSVNCRKTTNFCTFSSPQTNFVRW